MTPEPRSSSEAMVRSALYRLLARSFRYPDRELYLGFRTGAVVEDLRSAFRRVEHLRPLAAEDGEAVRQRVRKDLKGKRFSDFEPLYVKTFDVGFPEPPCPPYEGIQRGVERTQLMIEVAEFYKQFGLAMSKEEGTRELPDYLSAELEFMHFLAFKEAHAIEEGDAEMEKGYVWAQRDFLDRHLATWLGPFAEKLDGAGAPLVYAELARIAARFLTAEKDRAATRLEALGGAPPPERTPEARA